MAQLMIPKPVRIRIAVVMDADGDWSAAGWNGASDNEAMEAAVDGNGDLSGLHHECFVSVQIPLPRPAEFVGMIEAA